MNKNNEIKSAAKTGSIAAIIGGLCCITPLVLVLVGLSGVSGAMALAGYLQQNFRWTVFIPLATIFLIASIYFHIKKKAGVCNIKTIKHCKWYVITTILFAVIIWALLLYIIVPEIFSLIS